MIRADLYLAGINLGVFLNISHFCTFGLGHHAFWKLLSNCSQPVTAKRLYGLILSATKVGGILGGICLGPLIQSLGQINVLILWALAYLVSGFVLIIFERKIQFKENLQTRRNKLVIPAYGVLITGYREVTGNTFLIFFAILIALDICTEA